MLITSLMKVINEQNPDASVEMLRNKLQTLLQKPPFCWRMDKWANARRMLRTNLQSTKTQGEVGRGGHIIPRHPVFIPADLFAAMSVQAKNVRPFLLGMYSHYAGSETWPALDLRTFLWTRYLFRVEDVYIQCSQCHVQHRYRVTARCKVQSESPRRNSVERVSTNDLESLRGDSVTDDFAPQVSQASTESMPPLSPVMAADPSSPLPRRAPTENTARSYISHELLVDIVGAVLQRLGPNVVVTGTEAPTAEAACAPPPLSSTVHDFVPPPNPEPSSARFPKSRQETRAGSKRTPDEAAVDEPAVDERSMCVYRSRMQPLLSAVSARVLVHERRVDFEARYASRFKAFIASLPQLSCAATLLVAYFPRVDHLASGNGRDIFVRMWRNSVTSYMRAVEFSLDPILEALADGRMPLGCTQALAVGAGHDITRVRCKRRRRRVREARRRNREALVEGETNSPWTDVEVPGVEASSAAMEEKAKIGQEKKLHKQRLKRLGLARQGRRSRADEERLRLLAEEDAEKTRKSDAYEKVWRKYDALRVHRLQDQYRGLRTAMHDLRRTREEVEAAHPLLGSQTSQVDVSQWLKWFGPTEGPTSPDFSFAATGLEPWQVAKLFAVYCPLPSLCDEQRFIIALVYLRQRPQMTARDFRRHLPGLSLSDDTLVREVYEGVTYLALVLDEIGECVKGREWFTKPWADKTVNNFPLIPCTTLAVDVFPVSVSESPNDYSGYYKRHVKKIQLTITPLGFIAGISNVCPGPQPDGEIWGKCTFRSLGKAAAHRLPLRAVDLVLADGAYASGTKCTIPSRRLAREGDENRRSNASFFEGLASDADKEYNRAHAFARGRVERAIRRLRNWKVFQATWNLGVTRGGTDFMNSCFKAAAHVHNFRCRWRIPEMPLSFVCPSHVLFRHAQKAWYPWDEQAVQRAEQRVHALLDAWTVRQRKPHLGTITPSIIPTLENVADEVCPHVAARDFRATAPVWVPRHDPDTVIVEGAASDETSVSDASVMSDDNYSRGSSSSCSSSCPSSSSSNSEQSGDKNVGTGGAQTNKPVQKGQQVKKGMKRKSGDDMPPTKKATPVQKQAGANERKRKEGGCGDSARPAKKAKPQSKPARKKQ